MKRFFVLFFLLLAAVPGMADSRSLVSELLSMMEACEVEPDSFHTYVRRLKADIAEQKDPACVAVYRATLAHLLCCNTARAQAWDRETLSHPDSTEEWTSREYTLNAEVLYSQALADKELLHGVPTKAWLPLVSRGKNEKIYGSSMLYVVWHAMRDDLGSRWFSPHVSELVALYRRHGLREAELSLRLDSISDNVEWEQQPDCYRALMKEYRDLPCCDAVYERLASRISKSEERRALLEEGLRLYPRSALLRNAVIRMDSPMLTYTAPSIVYPGTEEMTVFRLRNISAVRQSFGKQKAEWRKYGNHLPYEEWTDTLVWQTPEPGEYTLRVEGKTNARLLANPKADEHPLCVSRLAMFRHQLPDGTTQFMVVDRLSGKPIQDARVELIKENNKYEDVCVAELVTDARGIAECRDLIPQSYKIKVWKDDDKALPATSAYLNTVRTGYTDAQDKPRQMLTLYTDRSIYRPGQTVYVGAVAYSQKGFDTEVDKGRDVTIDYRDATGRQMAEHKLHADEFGVISDSIQLPKDAKPGSYLVRIGTSRAYIKVEEYRRPTFHVEMDEAPAVSLPLDTLFLTGKALTYSGVPMAGARVAGRMSFYSFWSRIPLDGGEASAPLDTIMTDAEGRFRIALPLKDIEYRIRYGARVCVDVDVLSSLGETQQASLTVPLSTRRYMLSGSVPGRQDKERLAPWHFTLLSSTGRPVEGDVLCTLTRKGAGQDEASRFSLPAGKDVVPESLMTLPSGAYDINAQYVNGSDTARWKQSVVLFSMSDSHLADAAPLALYCPCDTFGVGRPAQVQIGTSLDEAWLYCSMIGGNNVVVDTVMHVCDSAFVWTIDYKPEYKDGISISAAVYNKGQLHSQSLKLHKALPDKRLLMRWDTFRNVLRPGQQEEWRLSLRHVDGTPASANVLLSMYDASLDAIRKHAIGFSPVFTHSIPSASYSSLGEWYNRSRYIGMDPKLYPLKERMLSYFNQEYFTSMYERGHISGLSLSPQKMMAKGVGMANDMVLYSAPMAVHREVAETGETASAEEDNGASAEGDSGIELRGNKDATFTELAFFMPMLRTDANGIASIAFTLPESLTSWHLMGFAHTRDMSAVGIDECIVAQKELMAELFLPRFVRTSDRATFTASVRNISDRRQEGKATCLVLDAETEKVLQRIPYGFALDSSADTTYTISLSAPSGLTSYIIKWMAEGTDCSDGEQRLLPVLSDMEKVTETRAFSLNKTGTTRLSLASLFAGNHPSAVNRGMTVEYTTRPMWLALKSLPSLFVPHCRNVLCQTSAYYATTLAQNILRSTPETEWLQDSLHYEPMLSLDNRMALLSSIASMQEPDGSFAWFPGMRGNAYMTREVAYLLVRLHTLGIETDAATLASNQILASAISYLTAQARQQIERMKRDKDTYVGLSTLRYLYIVTHCGTSLDKRVQKDADFLLDKLMSQDMSLHPEDAAIAAIVLGRKGRRKEALQLMSAVVKRLRHKDGFYLAYPGGSFTSIDRKLQTHVQILEAVREVMPGNEELIAGMTEWLLLQKRTQQWDEPSLTANAVYALLMDGTEDLTDRTKDVVKLRDKGGVHTFVSPNSQLGYLRDSIGVERPQELVVDKRSKNLSWGAVYATYDMPMDSVRADWQGFKIRREVSASNILVGDRVHVRYTITADRDYDFVSMNLPRPAAAEPVQQVSGYRFQGGLGYYMSVRDSGQEYYFDSMPKGTYVLEEDWLITRKGSYTTGPAVIKCLYAPEYQSHTRGERVEIR